MTELEEKFYKVMGIEPNIPITVYKKSMSEINVLRWDYPPITDRILLELVCILNKTHYKLIMSQTIDGLKREVLFDCLAYSDDIKSDVRKLFEE